MLLATAVGAADEGALARDMLAAHNAVRAKTKERPLIWSDNLARLSQEWANSLIARHEFAHQAKSKYGENLFEVEHGRATPAHVVERWASEVADYDYKSNRCRSACGHYTQIVWRDTKEVGCAVARGGSREVWVCEYNPPGNYTGYRPY
jgi:pathogenesis-related protein 1